MREHTQQMRLPRFLWVPFELGRPFGAPGEAAFQRRVLHRALQLLERTDGPTVLEDFPDEAPRSTVDEEAEGWSCPVSFALREGKPSELVAEVLEERSRLAAWHEIYVDRRGRGAPAASGLAAEEVVRGLGALAHGEVDPEVTTDLPLQEWVRLGCDDLRTWYMEAAQGQPGRATSRQLDDWLWRETALARLIAAAATTLLASADPQLHMFGLRAMVPRTHFEKLLPGVEPFV